MLRVILVPQPDKVYTMLTCADSTIKKLYTVLLKITAKNIV